MFVYVCLLAAALSAIAEVSAHGNHMVSPRVHSTVPSTCRVDALYHGSHDGISANISVAIKTSFGPPAAFGEPRGSWTAPEPAQLTSTGEYYVVPHSAVPCGGSGSTTCLYADGHACTPIHFGNVVQCGWSTPDLASASCGNWTECQAFYCQTIPTGQGNLSGTTWCFARAASGINYDPTWHNATSYVKSSASNSFSAQCTSISCTWTYGVGFVQDDHVFLTTSSNTTLTGSLLDDCSQIVWSNGGSWENVNLQVETVHVVFMAHFDVGYTEYRVNQLLDDYITKWFPAAINTSNTLRNMNSTDRFVWTTHPWLLLSLFRNDTGASTPEFIRQITDAINRGDINWHANPMNMQAEAADVLNLEMGFQEAKELSTIFNQEYVISASQKDEPGGTLGMVEQMARAGIKFLHVGANDFSTVPAMPKNSAGYHGYCNPFFWQDTSVQPTAEIVASWCSGYSGPYQYGIETPNMMTVVPGLKHALAYLMHVDNRGPQDAEQVLEGYDAVRRAFPNAHVAISTMDAFASQLLKARSTLTNEALPTLQDVEPGSTWIYGVASQPQKMRWYRAISRVAQQAVTNNTVSKEDPEFQEFHRLALKIPEHTWGREGPCLGNYTNQEFHDPHYLCSIGSEFYQLAVDSYSDQQAYVLKAIAALSSYPNLQQQMNDTLNSSEPAMPDFSELLPYDNVGQAFTIFNTSIMINQSGCITLLKSAQKTFASENFPIGLFSYATHSQEQLDAFGEQYALEGCSQSCGHCAFSRCNYSPSGAETTRQIPQATAVWRSADFTRFVFNLTFTDASIKYKYAPPQFATLEVRFSSEEDDLVINYDLNWWNKPQTRMAESLWMTFAFADTQPQGWLVHKLGKWIDPLQVVVNGSQTMHAVDTGFQYCPVANETCQIKVESLDAPIVSPTVNYYPTGSFNIHPPAPQQGWAFNLFNNAWATNYPIFSLNPNNRFRFKVVLHG